MMRSERADVSDASCGRGLRRRFLKPANAQRDTTLTVCLVLGDTLHVDDKLLPVDSGHLALTALVLAAHNLHLIVLADGQGAHLYNTTHIIAHKCERIRTTSA